MRFRSAAEPGHYRIFERDEEVGYIRPGVVSFGGFASQGDAAVAAGVANRALAERRDTGTVNGIMTAAGPADRRDPPRSMATPGPAAGEWSVEVVLDQSARASVFTMSRARTIWRALLDGGRWSGEAMPLMQG